MCFVIDCIPVSISPHSLVYFNLHIAHSPNISCQNNASTVVAISSLLLLRHEQKVKWADPLLSCLFRVCFTSFYLRIKVHSIMVHRLMTAKTKMKIEMFMLENVTITFFQCQNSCRENQLNKCHLKTKYSSNAP